MSLSREHDRAGAVGAGLHASGVSALLPIAELRLPHLRTRLGNMLGGANDILNQQQDSKNGHTQSMVKQHRRP